MATLQIETVRIDELCDLAAEAASNRERFPFLPVTELRARSYANNPAASPDDIGLLLAFCDGRCVGYMGILQGMLRGDNGLIKVASFSTWYVDESQRGTGAGLKILKKAMSLGYDYYLTGFTEHAGRLYAKTGWAATPEPLRYLRVRISRVLPWMSILGRAPASVRKLLTPAAWAVNRLVFPALVMPLLRLTSANGADLRRVSEVVPPEPGESLNQPERELRVHRDAETVNWMIRYPWIDEGSKSDLNYAFSYQRERFEYMAYQVRGHGRASDSGYVVFQLSGNRAEAILTILDVELNDRRVLPAILEFALRKTAAWRVSRINIPLEFKDCTDANGLLRKLTRQSSRGYFFHAASPDSEFADAHNIFQPSYCDSDMPFV